MDKIICDVCGTSYPDSADQCPICGYVHSSTTKSVDSGDGHRAVRGGRFSNGNVKRRSSRPLSNESKFSAPRKKRMTGSSFVLEIVAIILAVVAIFVIVFIASELTGKTGDVSKNPAPSLATQSEESDDVLILCQELHTDDAVIELAAEGATECIRVTPVPYDTTDIITYTSVDSDIAVVSSDGLVTAVSGGETAITVRCGEAMLIVTIKCTFSPPVPDGGNWSMNRKDITLTKKGETWDLYSKNSTIPKNLIVWTSDDDSVAKIDGGVVEAVGYGKTKVHGECNGVKYSCTIRCNIPKDQTDDPKETEPKGTEPEESKQPGNENKSAKISHVDVTLRPNGEANDKSFQLCLYDSDKNKLDVTWAASDDGYVTIEGNLITAIKAGKVITVSTTYEGITYECKVRLK